MANSAYRLESAAPAVAIAGASAGTPEAASVARPQRAGVKAVLSLVTIGVLVRVVSLDLEQDLRDWLRAVGIGEGERLVVLRRAAFGGPVHVRTSVGGEFALNTSLACCIHTESVA